MLKHQKVFQGKETLRENNRKSRAVPNQKKIQKYINHVTHPLSSSNLSIFSPLISNFCNIKKYRSRLHFDTYFFLLLRVCLSRIKCWTEKSITPQRIKNDWLVIAEPVCVYWVRHRLFCLTALKKKIPKTEKNLFQVLF